MIGLAPFTGADVDTLLGWIPDDRFLLMWAGPVFRAPLDRAQLEAHLQRIAAAGERWRAYKLVRDGVAIGYGELRDVDREHRRATLSRLLVGPKSHRGAGLGGVLVERLLAVAFDELRLHRVDLGVYDFNHAAIACYRRCGFELEGTRREDVRFGDEWWRTCTMAILEDGWRARRSQS